MGESGIVAGTSASNHKRSPVSRDARGHFLKGTSGNPGGRERGLAERCRAAVNDGADVVEFMLSVLNGEMDDAKIADRIAAAEWFADRGWGKAMQSIELKGNLTVKSYQGVDVERV